MNNQPHIPHRTLLDMGQPLEREICRDFASNFFGADLVAKALLLQWLLNDIGLNCASTFVGKLFFTSCCPCNAVRLPRWHNTSASAGE